MDSRDQREIDLILVASVPFGDAKLMQLENSFTRPHDQCMDSVRPYRTRDPSMISRRLTSVHTDHRRAQRLTTTFVMDIS